MCLVHVIGLTRQRDESYIGCVFFYIYVIGLARQRNEGFIASLCIHVYVHDKGLTRQRV